MGLGGDLPDEAPPPTCFMRYLTPQCKRSHPIDHGQKRHEAYEDLAAGTETFAEKSARILLMGKISHDAMRMKK